jgi:adenosine deaminase
MPFTLPNAVVYGKKSKAALSGTHPEIRARLPGIDARAKNSRCTHERPRLWGCFLARKANDVFVGASRRAFHCSGFIVKISIMPGSSILLCTMGVSWQVVPEAFLYKPDQFREVHCFSTSSDKITPDPAIQFFERYPKIHFTVSLLAGLTDLRTNEDHQGFEEALFRWYLKHLTASQELPFVCVAGGFKSMSAGLQKAAGLFGATEVFHVLAEPLPQTADEIERAAADSRLNFISLGPEPGWSRLQMLDPGRFPLRKINPDGSDVVKVTVDNYDLGKLIREDLDLISRRAEGWERAAELPFPSLALWQPRDADWLYGPLDPNPDVDWVRALPKIELHCHLGGFGTHGELLEQVRAAATELPVTWPEPPALPAGWPRPLAPVPLDDYLRLGDATGRSLLKDPGCLKRHIELLYQCLLNDNIIYAEIRCSPNNYISQNRSAWQVLEDIRATFQHCMDTAKESGQYCQVNLIIIATRKPGGDLSDISRHLALAITSAQHIDAPGSCRVVGVDLAGLEAVETRAAHFASEFSAIHRCGVAITAHAGETDDAEGIWQAVFKLHARRLGHALRLHEAPDLQRTVIERRIGVEMCPFANYQIRGFAPMPDRGNYPLPDYLRSGVPVTVNTDNIGISAASLSDNLLFLSELCSGLTRLEVLRLQANALDVAFVSHSERQKIRQQMEAFLAMRPIFK